MSFQLSRFIGVALTDQSLRNRGRGQSSERVNLKMPRYRVGGNPNGLGRRTPASLTRQMAEGIG